MYIYIYILAIIRFHSLLGFLSNFWFIGTTMCDHTSHAQGHELPQIHPGDNQEGTLLEMLEIVRPRKDI